MLVTSDFPRARPIDPLILDAALRRARKNLEAANADVEAVRGPEEKAFADDARSYYQGWLHGLEELKKGSIL